MQRKKNLFILFDTWISFQYYSFIVQLNAIEMRNFFFTCIETRKMIL